jgi:AraC family transcriptional regulator
MDWPGRMMQAIDYIEDNLADEISLTEAARIACCSPFYFQRLFTIITGMTVAEYVRRRRLTLAAVELASGRARVIDVALKYGYDSPDSFTRAFRAMHGVTPLAARERGIALVACPRISFQIEVKGGTDMEYKIVEKPAFPIAVTTRRFTTYDEQNFVRIPEWWREFLASPECSRMTSLAGNAPGAVTGGTMLGVCFADDKPVDFSYGIGVELPDGASSGPFQLMQIPAATWAVFGCTLANLQEVTRRIFREWFPSVDYEHDAKPELEVYLPEGQGQDMRCEIWIPVTTKNN